MNDSYNFSSIEIEDLMNNHAYEVAEILEQAYSDIQSELTNVGDFYE